MYYTDGGGDLGPGGGDIVPDGGGGGVTGRGGGLLKWVGILIAGGGGAGADSRWDTTFNL